ncbi:hypothetical protein IHQ68_04955 [Chelatococcus sambhunathii]|uniref:Uncharacterized protein n=1 Tax=Chelatococcus sambhunathii TaxID=363953 RepID=A0ABU1DCZ6_9HYPH|nr:hypothetical protein [Chelatococcus sambhunathii]MDR4305973.1 hypothetical protein [Chelatococcus sambhunathii]
MDHDDEGPQLEENFRRAIQINERDLSVSVISPIGAVILGVVAARWSR